MAKSKNNKIDQQRRKYIKQVDVPLMSLEEALRIPLAILDHYAGKSTSPLYVAKALNIDPKGSQLRLLSGAAIAFGLIDGGAQASTISITELSKRILRPKQEGDDLIAKREAVLTPRIFKEFLAMYDGSPFPRQDIALNVLEDMSVPRDKANEVLLRIESSAKSVGFIEEIKGKAYVSLNGSNSSNTFLNGEKVTSFGETDDEVKENFVNETTKIDLGDGLSAEIKTRSPKELSERFKKVFITHGKNTKFIEPIKKLLSFGELLPVVSVEKTSISQPVPDKVLNDMRSCGAAIIHVEDEVKLIDDKANEHIMINQNVLIEIGAAMALFGRRFILLVKEGIKLPSNLQGLFEVRYSGDELDGNATIKLLEAINDIKNQHLPS